MNKGKLIMIMGSPSSGKSTLASGIHTKLKQLGENSIFISEVATDYIAEYGIPETPLNQMTIFYQQMNRELMFLNSKDYIICDSSSILNYFYFRQLFGYKIDKKDIAAINHIQKEILKHLENIYKIYYVPILRIGGVGDGIRFHNEDEIEQLDRWVKSYLELENINHVDLSKISINERIEYVINDLKV